MAKPNLVMLISSLLMVHCFSSTLSFRVHPSHAIGPNQTLVTSYYQIYPRSVNKLINKIDSCWRFNPNWALDRKALADCGIGFGSGALGGQNGPIYVVTDPSDDPVNPKWGTLRYGAIQAQPLWIIFGRDMVITLENELVVSSYKTIDGRGCRVEISNGPCITIEGVSHVIIHGLIIQDCRPAWPGPIRISPDHVSNRLGCDGDAISVIASSNVWIDHCYFARCADGLIDITHASSDVTISNNYFTQHDKVMLLGHRDGYIADRIMKVTIVFNHFGPGLIQRLPRVRYGYAHVANNMYDQWIMYAIGGSADSTILSEGNYFVASDDAKEVTKREGNEGWRSWNWRSSAKDVFVNGAYFISSGWGSCAPNYLGSQFFVADQGSLVPALTSDAGPIHCLPLLQC